MGDRIAVLNAGYIQQIGPPQELYDHPSNLFVAGFIGSPAMNFFPGARVDGVGEQTTITLDSVGQVEIPPLFAGRVREVAGRNLSFGIRPEHLQDEAAAHTGGTLDLRVDTDNIHLFDSDTGDAIF